MKFESFPGQEQPFGPEWQKSVFKQSEREREEKETKEQTESRKKQEENSGKAELEKFKKESKEREELEKQKAEELKQRREAKEAQLPKQEREELEKRREEYWGKRLEKEKKEKEERGESWTTHAELERKEKRKLGLPENALWEEVLQLKAELEQEKRWEESRRYKERREREAEKLAPEYDKQREFVAGAFGLGKNASLEDIKNAWHEPWNEEKSREVAKYLGLPEDSDPGYVHGTRSELLNRLERIAGAKEKQELTEKSTKVGGRKTKRR